MNHSANEHLLQTLEKITITLQKLAAVADETALQTQADALSEQIHQLQSLLTANLVPSYEFYQACSEAVDEVTELRLNPPLKNTFRKQFWKLFNQLTEALRIPIYKHAGISESLDTASSLHPNGLKLAREKAHFAAQRAAQIAKDAEEANNIGAENLARIQQEGEKNQGLINPALLQESMAHTLTMSAKNAAAVLAVDASTAAWVELESLLENQKSAKE